MAVPRKKLCDVCLESFPEDELVAAGTRIVCAPCAERTGVRTTDLQRRAIEFGREIFRCLAHDDLDKFRELLLTDEEVPLAIGDTATADHATLIRARVERDFKSKRLHYFKDAKHVAFLDFRLGPIESGTREVQRYGRSTLRMRVDGRERTLVIQHVYGVKGKIKIEFFE